MADSKKSKASKGKAPPKKKKTEQIKDTIQESLIMKMKEEQQVAAPSTDEKAEGASWESPIELKPSRKKAPTRDVNFFMRQMAVLLSAGVPLMRSLKILTNRVRNADFRIALVDVMAEVERGSQFWSALARHPQYFNTMAVNVIRTGEESGSLTNSMTYLANYRDRETEMIRSVERAVTYPLFLLILAIGVVFMLITMVIPIFAEQFQAANVPLPWPTRFVLGLSSTLTNFWIVIIVLGVVGYIVYKKVDLSRGIVPLWDRLKIRLPIFGRILVNIYTAQFATMMSILLNSGLPLLRTLELVRATLDNTLYKDAFDKVSSSVERGRTLSESLAEVNVFPPIVLDMVAVGEEAGSLPDVMDQVADNYQKEVDHDTAVIGTLIEPFLIVGLGLVVGFIAISVFLPYFNMVSFIAP